MARWTLGVAGDRGGDVAGERGFFRMVVGDRIVRLVVDVDGGAVGGRQAGADGAQALLRGGRHFLAQGAHRAGELDLFGDDVVGVAAMEFGHRHHHRIDRIDRCARRSSAAR